MSCPEQTHDPTKLQIGQILAVFAIVIAGIWFATQSAAWQLAYLTC